MSVPPSLFIPSFIYITMDSWVFILYLGYNPIHFFNLFLWLLAVFSFGDCVPLDTNEVFFNSFVEV